jgi:hypothetical protein
MVVAMGFYAKSLIS